MGQLKDIFKIYLSHSIRGVRGINATHEEIKANLKKYIAVGTEIKAYLIDWEKLLMCGFPKMELYVPADHDEFVQIAFDKDYINEKQILDVDCDIINTCSLLIACGDHTQSRGMKVEIQHAKDKGIPIYYMPTISDSTIRSLKYTLKLILEDT